MDYAVVLAWDRGENLRPLTSDETPSVLLSLGDRRSLLRRATDRLADVVPQENHWIVAPGSLLPQLRREVDEASHLVDSAAADTCSAALGAALARARSLVGPRGVVVVTGSTYLVGAARASLLGLHSDPPIDS